MAERKSGAGMHLSGVLERATPPRPPEAEVDAADQAAEPAESESGRGRGAARRTAPAKPAAKKVRGRTIYIPDDLFERILVQAHRRDLTISDYVVMILNRQVPDHRTRAEPGDVDG